MDVVEEYKYLGVQTDLDLNRGPAPERSELPEFPLEILKRPQKHTADVESLFVGQGDLQHCTAAEKMLLPIYPLSSCQ